MGKTTLFNIIIGQLPRQEGEITLGYNVHPTIFAQDQTKSLNGEKTILENITEKCPRKTESEIRWLNEAIPYQQVRINKWKLQILAD